MEARNVVGRGQRRPVATNGSTRPVERLVLVPDIGFEGIDRNDPATHAVSNSQVFRRFLMKSRPALVVVFAPPATPLDIEAVASERRRRRDMRTALINAPDQIADRLAALRSGFDEALDSLVSGPELSGRLALLADEARGMRAEHRILISPDIVLDVETRELRVGGRGIHLRPREYALLDVLARNPGRTFSRRQLLDAIGADTSLRDMRTIDVHVRWLREKLDIDGAVAMRLVTVRGIGYRLDRQSDPAPTPEARSDNVPALTRR